jgi:predicted alpha/beta superfamily hydrolase
LDVWVYVPPGFSETDPWRYPTLYLHDGQNVFDEKSAAFGVEWGVDEAAERLISQRKMKGVIIVAVANTPSRMAHYTPFADSEMGGGQGAAYSTFLLEELKPWIDKTYPTSRRAGDTAIAGSSLGGLSALYVGFSNPDVFGMVAALSPSLWWGERGLITRLASHQGERPSKVWVDMGSEESDTDANDNQVPDVIDDLRTLRAVLLSLGYRVDQDLFYREVAGATHDEASWAGRIEEVLQTLYPFELTNPREGGFQP